MEGVIGRYRLEIGELSDVYVAMEEKLLLVYVLLKEFEPAKALARNLR